MPTSENWHFIAAMAIHRATRIWGGAGFILIPHKRGVISDLLIRVAVAYDPDHVVSIDDAAIADLVEANACEWEFKEGVPDPEALRGSGGIQYPLSPDDKAARSTLSSACTPYRYGKMDDGEAYDGLVQLESGPGLHASLLEVVPEDEGNVPTPSVLDPATRDVSLMIANRFGLAKTPDPSRDYGGTDPGTMNENGIREFDKRDQATFDYWNSPKSSWRAGLIGLTAVATLVPEPKIWVVLGSTFEDFALSYALERMEGNSTWIPPAWLEPESTMNKWVHRLTGPLFWMTRQGAKITVVSASMGVVDLNSSVCKLDPAGAVLPKLGGESRPEVDVVESTEVAFGGANHHLALALDYDHELVLPVRRDRNDPETAVLVNPFPALVPETNFGMLNEPTWHVDVSMHESGFLPSGRGLPWHTLQAGDSGRWPERTRSGRDGVSLTSGSFGLVLAGASLRQRLARPILRFPSAMSWVRVMAGQHGYDVSISAAGHKVKIAAEIWGGRDAMAKAMAAELPLIQEFSCLSSDQRTSDRYPSGDGCALRGEGFLTFEAMRRVTATGDDALADLRATVDELTGLGVLRRGLILGCPSCTRVQWVPVPEISKATCERCQARIPLNLASWRIPIEEPRWFYDLHPVVRDVITECGHVAVLGGRHLQREVRGRSTVLPDVEFKQKGDHFEIDLVLASRKKVVVGECKHRAEVPKEEVPRKLHALVRSAELLRADEIVLAAGQPGRWDEGFLKRLGSRVLEKRWIGGRQPRIRLLTDVFGDLKDEYYEPDLSAAPIDEVPLS